MPHNVMAHKNKLEGCFADGTGSEIDSPCPDKV